MQKLGKFLKNHIENVSFKKNQKIEKKLQKNAKKLQKMGKKNAGKI